MPEAPPRLLVSVFALHEIEAALEGSADVVDVKDPTGGPLGAPEPELLRAARARIFAPVHLSAALGDAPHLPGTLSLAAAAADCGCDYVKIGLGSTPSRRAVELLSAVREAASAADPRTRVVAVAYADAGRVGGFPPAALPAVARSAGLHGVMLDTAVKDRLSTLAAMGLTAVAAFIAEARDLGLMTALAGSLGVAELPELARLGVDIVGVRGAACEGGRGGAVSAARVRGLRAALSEKPSGGLLAARPSAVPVAGR